MTKYPLTWLRCRLGCHELYSFADQPETMLLPIVGDSTQEIIRKFHETAKLRCRHCPYVYPPGAPCLHSA